MRLLLDTHVFLWAALSPDKLSASTRAVLADRSNEVFVSAAAAWEIVLKFPTGKIKLPMEPTVYVPTRIAKLGFASLPITQAHVLAVSSLPATHKDPFDRLMIAQALSEGLTFVTRDAAVLTYEVNTMKA